MSLAIATSIPVREWMAEPDEVVYAALDILREQADRIEKASNRTG